MKFPAKTYLLLGLLLTGSLCAGTAGADEPPCSTAQNQFPKIQGLAQKVEHAASQNEQFPEVVALFSRVSFDGRSDAPGRCTGTFIHPRLLLTAAHCVRHFNVSKMGGITTRATDMSNKPVPDLTAGPKDVYIPENHWYGIKEIHPVRVYVSPNAMPLIRGDLNLNGVEQDLAILEFAADFPKTRPVANQPPHEAEPVHIVGYGHHWGEGNPPPTVSRYIGQNKLSVSMDGAHVVKGSAATCDDPGAHKNDWATCTGDSGGPLVNSRTGQIIGVTSNGITFGKDSLLGKTSDKLSIFTDVTSGDGAKFVQSVLDDYKTRHR